MNLEDAQRFKRMIFRITRGTTWTVLANIDPQENAQGELSNPFINPKTNETVKKTVFLIVYQGGIQDQLKRKLNRLCDAFDASKYNVPRTY